MKVGDLIDIDDMGIGAVVDVWRDDIYYVERACVWLISQQRHIFITTHEWGDTNESR